MSFCYLTYDTPQINLGSIYNVPILVTPTAPSSLYIDTTTTNTVTILQTAGTTGTLTWNVGSTSILPSTSITNVSIISSTASGAPSNTITIQPNTQFTNQQVYVFCQNPDEILYGNGTLYYTIINFPLTVAVSPQLTNPGFSYINGLNSSTLQIQQTKTNAGPLTWTIGTSSTYSSSSSSITISGAPANVTINNSVNNNIGVIATPANSAFTVNFYVFVTNLIQQQTPNIYTSISFTLSTTKSSGGTTIGPYTINSLPYLTHIFTSSGTFTLNVASVLDILVVGGGGGAAGFQGGGAGAGGLVFRPLYSASTGSYTVTVGLGGIGVGAGTGYGNNGNDSLFTNGTYTLTGVGGATGSGTNGSSPGKMGGSGGGACVGGGSSTTSAGGNQTQRSQPGDSGTYGYGNNGGECTNGACGGGGGGAGNPGGNGTAQNFQSGGGGNGLYQVTINSTVYNFATIFNTTTIGVLSGGQYYLAGGGASGYGISGGLGGGGTGGGTLGSGGAGAPNTGGGAGAAGNGFSGTNASGGSGIVVIRVSY